MNRLEPVRALAIAFPPLLAVLAAGCNGARGRDPTRAADSGQSASVVELAAAGGHACARLDDGSVRCWGYGGGQLGDGSTDDRSAPVIARGIVDARELAVARDRSCARAASGRWWCWGQSPLSPSSVGDEFSDRTTITPVEVVELGEFRSFGFAQFHGCVSWRDGSVSCLGRNERGQSAQPTEQSLVHQLTKVAALARVEQVVAGNFHSCARLGDGSVRCWGDNAQGQLGDGSTRPRSTPAPVDGLVDAVELAAGSLHTCARRTGGEVVCWGRNALGTLGDGTTQQRPRPVAVTGLRGARDLACGEEHCCSVVDDGTVRCWGGNGDGQLGDGDRVYGRLAPVSVRGASKAVAVAVGDTFSCALDDRGAVSCWGGNGGHLGDGQAIASLAPVRVAITGTATPVPRKPLPPVADPSPADEQACLDLVGHPPSREVCTRCWIQGGGTPACSALGPEGYFRDRCGSAAFRSPPLPPRPGDWEVICKLASTP